MELSHPDLEILFTTAWEIWNARNRLLWDKQHTNVDDIWQRASGMATEFLEAGLDVSEAGGMNVVEGFSCWRPPEAQNFKLNLAFCLDSGKTNVGFGVLIRDQMGFVAAAMSQQMPSCDDKVQIHALIVIKALQFAYEVGLRRLEVDLVCKDLCSILKSDSTCFAPNGNLLDDISVSCQRCGWKTALLVLFLMYSLI
uniref:RNase H type-1 domain-containing protein n=1 Tax=Fagus sylvatica TaxID=28930 RepID=A0A2N9F838_FAGSY